MKRCQQKNTKLKNTAAIYIAPLILRIVADPCAYEIFVNMSSQSYRVSANKLPSMFLLHLGVRATSVRLFAESTVEYFTANKRCGYIAQAVKPNRKRYIAIKIAWRDHYNVAA